MPRSYYYGQDVMCCVFKICTFMSSIKNSHPIYMGNMNQKTNFVVIIDVHVLYAMITCKFYIQLVIEYIYVCTSLRR